MYPMARGATKPGPARVVVRPRPWAPRVIGYSRQQAFFGVFFDWNTHFVVFSGGVERGLEVRRPDLGRFAGTGAGRLGGFI